MLTMLSVRMETHAAVQQQQQQQQQQEKSESFGLKNIFLLYAKVTFQ